MSNELQVSDYSIVIECEKPFVSEAAELDEFIVKLMYHPSEDDDTQRCLVGEMHAYVARRNRGCSMYDACDAQSQELHNAWSSLYKLRTEVRGGQTVCYEDLRYEETGEEDGGFLFVQFVRVSPKHQGKRLGLYMIEHLVHVVGHGLSAVVLEACPFNATKMSQRKADAGRAALAKYYGEMGFRPLRSGFMVLELPLDWNHVETFLGRSSE